MVNFRDVRRLWAGSLVIVFAMVPTVFGRYHHTIKMGPSVDCDNGKFKTDIDWKETNSTPYTCTLDKKSLPIKMEDKCPYNATKLKETEETGISEERKCQGFHHVCMNESIEYKSPYPASGRHRPVWPKYGVYEYAPPQRWLHNLEHGAIVALYHPCVPEADKKKFIKALACAVKTATPKERNSLPMFTVTPEVKIPSCQPFVLVAWMHRLLMTKVLPKEMKLFVHKYYRKGPEGNTYDGVYKKGLSESSKKVLESLQCK